MEPAAGSKRIYPHLSPAFPFHESRIIVASRENRYHTQLRAGSLRSSASLYLDVVFVHVIARRVCAFFVFIRFKEIISELSWFDLILHPTYNSPSSPEPTDSPILATIWTSRVCAKVPAVINMSRNIKNGITSRKEI